MNKPYDFHQQSLDIQRLLFGPDMAIVVTVGQVRVEGLSGKDTQRWYHGDGVVLEVHQPGPSQPVFPSWFPGDLMIYDIGMTWTIEMAWLPPCTSIQGSGPRWRPRPNVQARGEDWRDQIEEAYWSQISPLESSLFFLHHSFRPWTRVAKNPTWCIACPPLWIMLPTPRTWIFPTLR